MKSLILKDLYNIGHNTKSMLFILAVFAVAFIPTSGVGASLYESGAKIPPGDVLIEMATLFNISLDYLVGIDKNEMVSINHLSAQQKSLIHTLLVELRDPAKAQRGLSPRQQDILSTLMQEFANKNMRS